MRLGILLAVGIWAVILLGLSGCGAIGVKNVDLWGAKMEFSEGVDYRVGFNSIDEVNDQRGLSKRTALGVANGRNFNN